MEKRQMKFYSKDSNAAAIHALPGHFATSHSHINYYIDITSLKTRINEAKEVAKVLAGKFTSHLTVDTIVCMDGTEVIGAFLSEELEKRHILSTINLHKTVYVVSPEINANNQVIFRSRAHSRKTIFQAMQHINRQTVLIARTGRGWRQW